MRKPFLDPATSFALDLIRIAAALVVLIGHAGQLGLYGAAWPLLVSVQHDAVIIFFVLSGVVIRATADRPGMSGAIYARARAWRILPVALPAVLFSLLAAGRAPTMAGAILPALFLSERWGDAGLVANPPYWSLCYEVAYYALFGLWRFASGWRRWALILLVAFVVGPRPLLLMPVWLLGVGLAGSRRVEGLSRAEGGLCLILGVGGFLVSSAFVVASPLINISHALKLLDMHFSDGAVSDLLLGLWIAVALAGVRGLATGRTPPSAIARAVRWAAGVSFPLYLFHWPAITLMRAAGVSAGGDVLQFVLLLTLPIALAIGVDRLNRTIWPSRASGGSANGRDDRHPTPAAG